MSSNYFPFKVPEFREKIVFPQIKTIVDEIPREKMNVNKKVESIPYEYNFIDRDKLLKLNKKKYTVGELREIAKKLEIDQKQGKQDLINAIRAKIKI